ncbi:hypothetical protein SAMN06265378_10984 [Paracoccus sediminis]|uniref:Uncharacterized protein n=1 Tax=Paracoccus sediminis TaxID=1214787 RepID=A0A238XDG4_9RHOB|nr:hypothetical protein SAMN06265378_10984 [Paracoccus sediminis]
MKSGKFIPTREQWDDAGQVAERRHPYPATSTALATACGLFGGAMAAVIVLGLHGIDPSVYPGSRTVGLMGVGCGLVGYLWIRAQQRAHARVARRVLAMYEQAAQKNHRS